MLCFLNRPIWDGWFFSSVPDVKIFFTFFSVFVYQAAMFCTYQPCILMPVKKCCMKSRQRGRNTELPGRRQIIRALAFHILSFPFQAAFDRAAFLYLPHPDIRPWLVGIFFGHLYLDNLRIVSVGNPV